MNTMNTMNTTYTIENLKKLKVNELIVLAKEKKIKGYSKKKKNDLIEFLFNELNKRDDVNEDDVVNDVNEVDADDVVNDVNEDDIVDIVDNVNEDDIVDIVDNVNEDDIEDIVNEDVVEDDIEDIVNEDDEDVKDVVNEDDEDVVNEDDEDVKDVVNEDVEDVVIEDVDIEVKKDNPFIIDKFGIFECSNEFKFIIPDQDIKNEIHIIVGDKLFRLSYEKESLNNGYQKFKNSIEYVKRHCSIMDNIFFLFHLNHHYFYLLRLNKIHNFHKYYP